MTATATASETTFVRSRTTLLGYALMAYFGFALSLLGPAMPFIAERVGLTYPEMGYHFTLLAVGNLVSSLIGDRVARRIGSGNLAWIGVLLIALTFIGVVFGTSLLMTLTFTFLYGVGIGILALLSIEAIADAKPQFATKAYTEANIGGGAAMIVGPILIGLIAKTSLGWQASAFMPLIALIPVLAIFRGLPLPSHRQPATSSATPAAKEPPLPLMYWIFGVLMILAVAIEWLITSWGPSFLTNVVGYLPSTSALLVSVYALAIVLGRLVGRRLLDLMSEQRLMVASLVWILFSFPLYWLGTVPELNVLGLFLIGLGVGNLAPLSMSGAMAAASQSRKRASARFGIFPSIANVSMLQIVGVLADRFGILNAYSLFIVVVVVAIAMALGTNRMRAARASA
ncbi:MAG: MFS transporter [Anaerolineae bacterium]|nr:MFS transporter [Anaerolineae bacterium]